MNLKVGTKVTQANRGYYDKIEIGTIVEVKEETYIVKLGKKKLELYEEQVVEIVQKSYKIFWSYESSIGLEEGKVIIEAMSYADAENKFYERNTPHRTPDHKHGFSVDSIEEEN